MRKHIATAVIAAGIATAPLAAPIAPAHAADQRPCVSNVEWNGYNFTEGWGRTVLERNWEVTGLGQKVIVPGVWAQAIAYPWCDHPAGDSNGNINIAYAAVSYNDNRQPIAMYQYMCTWSEPDRCPVEFGWRVRPTFRVDTMPRVHW